MQNSSDIDQLSDSTVTSDEIKHKRNKWILAGIPFAPALFIFGLATYILTGTYVTTNDPGLFVATTITLAGIGLIVVGVSWGVYYTKVGLLQSNFPPPIIITERYAATKYGNTYVFTFKGSMYSLYFVALKQSSIVTSEKIRVPKHIWKFERFEGIIVRDAEGTFSIPTPEGNIISGEGLLRAVGIGNSNVMTQGRVAGQRHVPEETLHKMAEYVDTRVSGKPDASVNPDEGLNSPDL